MKSIVVVGARPQFIKAAAIMRESRQSRILHTGQHYDYNMSGQFFNELGLPAPEWNIDCRNNDPAMLPKIRTILEAEQPDVVIVFGDTFSTLAGAQAACQAGIDVAHIEAGLRSFNPSMPEEYNRIETDKISRYLFCPTHTAVENLKAEGILSNVYLVGDVMYDAALTFTPQAEEEKQILDCFQLAAKQYYLATIHRADTADSADKLKAIFDALRALDKETIIPLHPHTAKTIAANTHLQALLASSTQLHIIPPVGYRQMLTLEKNARIILTDSGGVQKEAYFQRTPCVTLRNETEWTETIAAGWNRLAGTSTASIIEACSQPFNGKPITEYGEGNAARQIIETLVRNR